MIRLWERALRRAEIRLAYTEGYSPHPRLSLAAPLAVGITSQAELMDVFVTGMVSPHWFTNAASQQLPPGIEILEVHQIAPTMPSLQSQVRFAEYRVEVTVEKERQEIEAAISGLLSLQHLPWHHQRDTGRRNYDLRALIDDIRLVDWNSRRATIEMRLRCDSNGSGRPEQVAFALGFTDYPQSIHRGKLILKT